MWNSTRRLFSRPSAVCWCRSAAPGRSPWPSGVGVDARREPLRAIGAALAEAHVGGLEPWLSVWPSMRMRDLGVPFSICATSPRISVALLEDLGLAGREVDPLEDPDLLAVDHDASGSRSSSGPVGWPWPSGQASSVSRMPSPSRSRRAAVVLGVVAGHAGCRGRRPSRRARRRRRGRPGSRCLGSALATPGTSGHASSSSMTPSPSRSAGQPFLAGSSLATPWHVGAGVLRRRGGRRRRGRNLRREGWPRTAVRLRVARLHARDVRARVLVVRDPRCDRGLGLCRSPWSTPRSRTHG